MKVPGVWWPAVPAYSEISKSGKRPRFKKCRSVTLEEQQPRLPFSLHTREHTSDSQGKNSGMKGPKDEEPRASFLSLTCC